MIERLINSPIDRIDKTVQNFILLKSQYRFNLHITQSPLVIDNLRPIFSDKFLRFLKYQLESLLNFGGTTLLIPNK